MYHWMPLNCRRVIGVKELGEVKVEESVNDTHIKSRIKEHRAQCCFNDIRQYLELISS